jgi:hypothetical protein
MNAARNELLMRALVRALEAFDRAGVHALPLKGVALAHSLYGDATLRVCSDLDVLVPRGHVFRALEVLHETGYAHVHSRHHGPDDRHLLLESNIEEELAGSSGGLHHVLELHWDIAWRWTRRDAMADLWAEARPQRLWGVNAYRLSEEWQLLYLAVHAARHRWHGLKWLVDIHEICSRADLDWPRVARTAERFGWSEVLALTLGVCRDLLDTRIPPGLRAVTPPPWLVLFPAPAAPADIWGDVFFVARLLRPRSEGYRYLMRLLFVPTLTDRRRIRLPLPLRGLYYLLRPLRLAGRWAMPRSDRPETSAVHR